MTILVQFVDAHIKKTSKENNGQKKIRVNKMPLLMKISFIYIDTTSILNFIFIKAFITSMTKL